MSHQYLINCSLEGGRPWMATDNNGVSETDISVHRGECNGHHSSSISRKPLIFTWFQVQARRNKMRGKNPVFSGSQIIHNFGFWHVKLPPRRFLANRTTFKWVMVLAILQRFHSISYTWQGDGFVNRPSSHTNV